MRLRRTSGRGRRQATTLQIITALLAPLLVLATSHGARANEFLAPVPYPEPFRREVWFGADVTSDTWLLYSGLTWAPWSGVHDDGIRFRFAGGYGRYRWEGHKPHDGVLPRGTGQVHYADVLAGYLKRFGPLTAKAFAGVSIIDHEGNSSLAAHDAGFAPMNGAEYGAKVAVELWLNIGSDAWSSLDLNWTSAHDTYSARWRLGWRAWPTVSLGVEAILNGDSRFDVGRLARSFALGETNRRAGLFVRYEWFGGEVSLAGGISVSDDDDAKPYATFNWITHF